MLACAAGREAIAQLLLSAGADPLLHDKVTFEGLVENAKNLH
jgi:ankyrin repeat protein